MFALMQSHLRQGLVRQTWGIVVAFNRDALERRSYVSHDKGVIKFSRC